MTVSQLVRSTITEDGVVFLDVSSGTILHSNGIGARIWIALRDGSAVSDIVEGLCKDFRVSRERVLADVAEYVEKLKQRGFVAE